MNKIKNIKNIVKKSLTNKLANFKNRFQQFKKDIKEAKNQPRSKRKSFLLGVATVLGIFGMTVAPVVAKDIPKNTPNPTPNDLCPAPGNQVGSQQLINIFSGAASTIYALAVTSGSFVIGGVCGIIVVIGILKVQGK